MKKKIKTIAGEVNVRIFEDSAEGKLIWGNIIDE